MAVVMIYGDVCCALGIVDSGWRLDFCCQDFWMMHVMFLALWCTCCIFSDHYTCEWFRRMGSRAGYLNAGLFKNHSPAIVYTKHCQMLLSIRSSATNENQHLSAVKFLYMAIHSFGRGPLSHESKHASPTICKRLWCFSNYLGKRPRQAHKSPQTHQITLDKETSRVSS